ncbi:RNA helicase [Chromatiales bacterium (ex Bugula neritina AB1)]|nr:RNA helicase [Chromatiales bacterium (ex Bugula neritina AB1)]
MKSNYLTSVSFSEFNLSPHLNAALSESGFNFCTEIQQLSLPLMLEGKDIAAQSQTGTGKTAAFLLGLYQCLLNNPLEERAETKDKSPTELRALILAPTRELAIQIHKDAEQIGANTGLSTVLAYGGTGYESQRRAIEKGAEILIGTPGRIIDYFKQGVFSLRKIEVVVLDEADRMFDLGFISDIRYLLRRMPSPEQRLNLLFSATLSHRVMELAYEHMNNPIDLKTESDQIAAEKVVQRVFHPASDEKIPLLLGLIKSLKPPRSIVFVNTKRVAERVQAYLVGNSVSAEVLSGDVRQNKRQRLINDLASGSLNTLIATDVAARGLHIEGVTHVFNFDLPQNAEDYVHRIGRTARAGASGEAISFACEEYVFSLPEIEDLLGYEIPADQVTDMLLVTPEKPARIQRDHVKPRGGPKRKRNPRHRKPRPASSKTS